MKRIIAFIVATIMVLSLVACGNGKTNSDDVSGNNGDTSNFDWSKGADASGGDVTLRVATWRQTDKPIYEELEKRFEEKYSWIDVKLEFNQNSNSYYSNMNADLMSGVGPDVFDSHPNAKLLAFVEAGMIAPQTDFDYMKNYKEDARIVTSIGGVDIGYLMTYNYFGVMFNKDIFAKEGITVPTTPDEFVAAVDALKKAGYGGLAFPGQTWGSEYMGAALLASVMGTDKYSEFLGGIDSGEITDVSKVEGVPEVFKTLSLYTEKDVYYNSYESLTADAALSLFAQKKTAMVFAGTYLLGTEGEVYIPGMNVGFFPLPAYGSNGMTYAEGGQTVLINAAGKNLGAAKLWVEFLATPEIASYFSNASEMLSSIEGVELTTEKSAILKENVSGYGIKSTDSTQNAEYWQQGWANVFNAVVYEGESWEEYVKIFSQKLEDYDLANLGK